MPITLKQFLAMLATDADLLAEYLRDKDKVIREAGLLAEDVAAFLSGGRSNVAARIEILVPAPAVEVVITVSTPGAGPVQVVTQPPPKKVYEPFPLIPTFTH